MQTIDQLTRQHTAFITFENMLTAEGGYRPSLYPGRFAAASEAELRALADAYDAAQAERGDARRAERGDPAWWRLAKPTRRRRSAGEQLVLATVGAAS